MNPRMARALLFEQVFRTTPMLALALYTGFLAIFAVSFLDGGTFADHEIAIVGQFTALTIAAGALLYTNSSANQVTCGIPINTLLLPVSTTTIVVVRSLWGAIAIMSISFALQRISLVMLDTGVQPWWVYGAVALAAFGILQIIAFGISRWGDLSLAVLAVSAILVAYLGIGIATEVDHAMLPSLSVAIFLVAACSAGGVVAVQRSDNNLPNVANLLPFTIQVRRRETTQPPFKSPQAAQRWLETMRLCSSFPALFLGLLGTSYLLHFVPGLDPANTLALLLGAHDLDHPAFFRKCLIASAAGAGAITAFLNFRLLVGPLRSFYFVRPMSTRDLATARLVSTIRVLLIPIVVLAVWLTVGAIAEIRESYRVNREHDNADLIPLLKYWLGDPIAPASQYFMDSLVSTWMIFWTPLVAAALTLFMIVGNILELSATMYWFEDSYFAPLLTAAGAACFLVTALLFRRAHRLGIFNARLTNTVLTIGFGLALALVALAEFANWNHSNPLWMAHNDTTPLAYVRDHGPSFVLILIFCALPFAAVPLTLHWTRHR